MLKRIIKKIYMRIRCKIHKAPMNCEFHRTSRIIKSHFEGKNKVASNTTVAFSKVGFGTYIAQNSNVAYSLIGRYSLVGYTSLLGGHPLHQIPSVHPAFYSTRAQYGFTYVKEDYYDEYKFVDSEKMYNIEIGNDVWVTAGSTKIVQGVRIGDGAVVLADAVVTKDVPPYAIVGGVPAKVVGYRFEKDQIDFLLKLKWWDRDEEWIKDHIDYFRDINILMNCVLKEEPELMHESEETN